MKKAKIFLLIPLILILPINSLINKNYLNNFNEMNENCNFIDNLMVSSTFENEFILEWNITWGSDFSDVPFDLALDSSNDIYLAGDSAANGSLVKFNNSGQYQWNRTYGTYAYYDEFFGITIDSSDNIYVAGWTESFNLDACFLKYNKSGDVQWEYTWGDPPNSWESAHAIALDSSENIYLAGNIDYNSFGICDIFLVKYNKSGHYQWNYTWGGSEHDECNNMIIDSLDNIYITGRTYNPNLNNDDIYLVKFDNLGQYQWNRTWRGNYDDYAYDIALDSSENVYLVGYTERSIDGNRDVCLVKYNNLGQYQWNRTWDNNFFDIARGIAIDPSDNIYIVGGTGDNNTNIFKYCLLKYNENGILQWSNIWGTWGIEGCEVLQDIVLDSSGNIYLAGYTNWTSTAPYYYDMILMKCLRMKPPIIENPKENELFGLPVPSFNLSINDPNLDSTWYTLNEGQKIKFDELNGIIDQTEWEKVGNGTVSIKFYLNNTLGYEGYSQVVLRKDIINPILTIYNPLDEQEFDIPPAFNVSIDEPNLESVWYTIDGGQTNITLTEIIGIINQSIWETAPYGQITVKFFAMDKVGNIGYAEVNIKKILSEDTSSTIPGYNLIILICLFFYVGVIIIKKNYS